MRHSLGLKALLPKLTHNAGLATTPTPALQFYHNHNIHNNENTGQTAHSAYARNATPSAKIAMPSGFGMVLSLFSVAGLSRPPCLITTPHPSAGRYPFAVASGVRSRFAVGFPIPCGAFLLQRLVRQLARFSRRAEDESNGFLRLAATGWALRPGFSQSRQCPCGCFVNKSGLGDKCRLNRVRPHKSDPVRAHLLAALVAE